MQRIKLLICALIIFFLAACQAAIVEEPVVEDSHSTEIAQPTAEATPEELASVDYCLDCHTEKEKLVATAKLEFVVESESKGVG